MSPLGNVMSSAANTDGQGSIQKRNKQASLYIYVHFSGPPDHHRYGGGAAWDMRAV
jgi:hypothetical protein